ncbi:unnamed protein product, partial [Polarella glacialis]
GFLVGAVEFASPLDLPQWLTLASYLVLAAWDSEVGLIQFCLWGLLLRFYGWRDDEGFRVTVYACQFCGQQFPNFEGAASHEQCCPYGTNVAVPVGGAPSVLGMPIGGGTVSYSTPLGHVVQHEAMGARANTQLRTVPIGIPMGVPVTGLE